MLESPAMDKKNSARSSSSAPKGNANSDAKSKQDGSGNKQQQQQQWPGGGGGPSGGGGRRGKWGGQQGEGRRPAPQRNRSTPDKRPQPKGQPQCVAQSSHQNSQGQRSQVARSIQDDCVEEALRKGNRKVNLNHLLKFTLTPRESDHHHHYWSGHHRSSRPPPAKHSKEQFLQANCQFVVREGTMCRWNPDVPIAWELVHEVRVLQQQSTTGQEEERCPVCLGTPRAAQMPPCGHVYCWSCLLHYLALSDRPYRPCPICDRAFSAQQLRRVVPQPRRGYQPGDEITMCLMRRQKNQPGAQPMPADLWRVDDLEPFNISREERLTCHQRVLVACPKQLGAMLDREESELRSQLLEEGDAPEACFVQAALQALQRRREDLEKEVGSLDVNANSQGDQLPTVDAEGNVEVPVCGDQQQSLNNTNDDNGDQVPDMTNSPLSDSPQVRGRERRVSSGSSGAEDDSVVGAEDLEMPVGTARNGSSNNGCRDGVSGGDSFYYFQAADGQPVFLHALNARMLAHEYGALELAPVKFTARIVEIEGASIDIELRRRLRYLRHLPLTCEIQVVEVQLEPPVIKQATVEYFAPDVEKRRRQRSRRARNEKRQDRLRAKEEMRRQGYGGGARYQLNSARHFPTCEPLGGPSPASPPPLHSSSAGSECSVVTVSDAEEHHQSMLGGPNGPAEELRPSTPAGSSANRVSFAQMLQTCNTGAVVGFQRRLLVKESPSPAPRAAAGSDDDDDEEHCPVPQYRQSFSLALEEALNAAAAASAASHADSAQSPDGQKGKPGSKKNKKKNVTLLFTTSMNRSK
ncbi:E3 ubiquitin-protein ligase RNF10 isoform X3 [Rhipicephalus microplus]|uniref:E3 ubiquitin-protein ligase RNF10 isoform X3 n=1 Tax=Rhipicephalus microplus TaxID=6941 RepID=UPI003F6A9414